MITGHLPTIKEPPFKAKPEVDLELLAVLRPDLLNDSYVYVHCHFNNVWDNTLIRIWKSTFLVDRDSPSKSELVHAENISMAPQWTIIPDRQPFSFLLIFSSLPKNCVIFDLVEDIAEADGFHVRNVKRNEKDVYHINLV